MSTSHSSEEVRHFAAKTGFGVPVVGAWGVGDVSYGFQMVSDFKVSNFWQTGRKVALELKCTAWINLVLTNMLQAI